VIANSLEQDLLAISGVEGAEVDGFSGAPEGLRIRIAEGADQEAVGGAIRRVLSAHGLGTDTRLPGEAAGSAATESTQGGVGLLTEEADGLPGAEKVEERQEGTRDEGRTIIDLTDEKPEVADPTVADVLGAEEQLEEKLDVSEPSQSSQRELPPFVAPRRSGLEPEPTRAAPPAPPTAAIARLDRVVVAEGRGGIVVTVVASDQTEVTQAAASTEGGVEAAVVKAAARLVDASSPDPIVVNIEDRRVEGVDVVMIVLDIDGELVAGSAVVAAGRAFALGRATWAALAL